MTDGALKIASTPTGRRRRAAARTRAPRPLPAARTDGLRLYAAGGVAVMAIMSALLNGYASGQHATIEAAGWAMGLAVPVIVLTLGKVAGLLYKRGHRRQAYATGATAAGLLFLSVWHCASSIALLTGSPLLLALPMAVAIDCGLIACEVAALVD